MTVVSIIKAMHALDEAYGIMGYECSAELDGCVYTHHAQRKLDDHVEHIFHQFEMSAENVSVYTIEE